MNRKSVTQKKWVIIEPNPRHVLRIIQRYGVDEIIARTLASKMDDLDEIAHFLSPTIKHFLPDPYVLLDMEKAVLHVKEALFSNKKIVVYADYDVDGATSSALLRRYFNDIQSPIGVYIPDRIEEGYGANTDALLSLKKDGADVIIMTDCGTTAFKPLQDAKEAGLDVIVLDHHTAEETLPDVVALVNPNRLDHPPLPRDEMRYLCAAGVSFLFIVALNRSLRESGYFNTRAEPNLMTYIDLVALGTVCDVMPLVGLNRAFTAQGLKVLSRRLNIGLAQLADVSGGVKQKPSTYHLGFVLGPRINAGGRVGQSILGTHLLSSDDPLYTKQIALQLQAYNQERQDIEKRVLEKAIEDIESKNLNQYPILLVSGDGWHPGVIGIVASRLKERFSKPSLVVGFDGDLGKGSGRSVAGVMMGDAMIKAVNHGLLEKGGGHAMAAGFTVHRDCYDAFYDFLNEELGPGALASLPSIDIMGALALSGITSTFVNTLEQLEPFGMGNPQPRFIIKNVRVDYMEVIGDGTHKRCRFVDDFGNQAKVMAFRVKDTPLEAGLERGRRESFDAIITVKKDIYNEQISITLVLEDIGF